MSNRETIISAASTLTSLAMLKLKVDQGGDYLDYLKPFVIWILKEQVDAPVKVQSTFEKLKEKFGLIIPNRTIEIVLKRLTREGYLVKKDGLYRVCNSQGFDLQVFDSRKAAAARDISSILSDLIKFGKENLKKQITEDDATDCIIAFLSKFPMGCLKIVCQGTALPKVSEENWKILLVSQYIGNINETNPERFESFAVLMKGHMLANALLCPDLDNVKSVYGDVTFYLDTQLLLKLIGAEDEQSKTATLTLVNLVRSLQGKVAFFSHTLNETINVIKNSSEYIERQDGSGSIVMSARKYSRTKSDLILMAESAEETLNDIDLRKVSTPSYINKLQIDEIKFENILIQEVPSFSYKEAAKKYDINSIRSIYVLRGKESPRAIEKCKAVLVTPNTGFAKAAYKYGKDIEQSREISPVISDVILANISWLKAPQEATELPKKEMMAFAYAANLPEKGFLDKVMRAAQELEESGKISSRDHQILRSYSAQEILLKTTLGEDSALNEENISEVVSRVSEEIKAEAEEKLVETKKNLEDERVKNKKFLKHARNMSDMISKWLANVVFLLLTSTIILGVIFSISKLTPIETLIPNSLFFVGIVTVSIVLGALNLIFGITSKGLRAFFRKKVFDFIFHKFFKGNMDIDTLE